MENNHIVNKSSLSMLIHGEGAAISSAFILGTKFQIEDLPYKDWRQSFSSGLNELRAEDVVRVNGFQDRFNEIFNDHNGMEEEILNSNEYRNLRNQVRGLSVQRRWDYERFLSENSSQESSTEVLGGYNSDGDYHNWTPEELETLSESNKIQATPDEFLGKRIYYEGHHGESISIKPYDNMGRMYDPDNVRIYSPKGHWEVHNGSWNNPTNESYTDVSDRARNIKNTERGHYSNESDADTIVGISMGVLAGSISAIIKYRELSKSPLPWNKKKTLAVAGALISGAATGVIPYFVIQEINTPVDNFIENGLADIFNQGSVLVQDSVLDNLADASGDFIVIMSAIAIRSLIQGGINANRYGFNTAFSSFLKTMGRTSIEQGGFFVLQLLLDCLTPIPDPVLGPVITILRITYSVGKITISIKHKKKLTQKNLDCLHDAAYALLT